MTTEQMDAVDRMKDEEAQRAEDTPPTPEPKALDIGSDFGDETRIEFNGAYVCHLLDYNSIQQVKLAVALEKYQEFTDKFDGLELSEVTDQDEADMEKGADDLLRIVTRVEDGGDLYERPLGVKKHLLNLFFVDSPEAQASAKLESIRQEQSRSSRVSTRRRRRRGRKRR